MQDKGERWATEDLAREGHEGTMPAARWGNTDLDLGYDTVWFERTGQTRDARSLELQSQKIAAMWRRSDRLREVKP